MKKYNHVAENPLYPFSEWQREVANCNTTKGYNDWVNERWENEPKPLREYEFQVVYAVYYSKSFKAKAESAHAAEKLIWDREDLENVDFRQWAEDIEGPGIEEL